MQALFASHLGLMSWISKQVVVVAVKEGALPAELSLRLSPWLRVRGHLGSSMESSFLPGTRPAL